MGWRYSAAPRPKHHPTGVWILTESEHIIGPPPATLGNADPVLAALAAERAAADAYPAAPSALDQADAFGKRTLVKVAGLNAWLTKNTTDKAG